MIKILKKIYINLNLILMKTKIGSRIFDALFQLKLKTIEKKNNLFVSVNYKPAISNKYTSIEKKTSINMECAILIQGPIGVNIDFLVETIKIYQVLYPGTEIIVSTWDEEKTETIEKLEQCEVTVVLNSIPQYNGFCNLNYQVSNTLPGIKKAIDMKKKYVFKTRTDCRFYKKNLLNFFVSLLKQYPLDNNIGYQKERIIGGGDILNSMFRPFWITDQFMFGTVEDMFNVWNYNMKEINISTKEIQEKIRREHYSWKDRIKKGYTAEPNLIIDYLTRMEKKEPECSVERYWDLVKKQFIMVSKEDVGFYWGKYDTKYNESYSNGTYYFNDSVEKCYSYNWDFASWLSLYSGSLVYESSFEKFSEKNKY